MALKVARMAIEPHQLDSLVVGAGGKQVAGGAPSEAVDAALVVFGALKEDCGRGGCACVPVNKQPSLILLN